jgi:fibronectin-binding autotransporter adhesin
MNRKSFGVATLLVLVVSPLIAAPTLNVTPAGIQGGNFVWDVSVTPDLALAGGSTPVGLELGFQLSSNIISVTNVNPSQFDANNPGKMIFGWETSYGIPSYAEGIEADCTGCTVTNPASGFGHAATVVNGTLNQIFAAMGSATFTTAGAKPFLQIVTQGPGNGGPANSTIQWLGAYSGQGRISQGTSSGYSNFDQFSGTQSQSFIVGGTNLYFDVNGSNPGSGVVNGGNYSWEGANWVNNVAAGDSMTINYIEGSFPKFAAGNDANGSYSVTMNANHTCVGMALEDGTAGSTLTINGTGTLGIDGGVAQGFIVRGGSNLKISNTLGGTGGVDFQSSGGTGLGSLYLYGNNTYQGGTTLSTAGGLNFNNNNSFGSGAVTWNNVSQVIADPDAATPITLANAMNTRASSTLIYVGPATAPVTFSGNWALASGVSTLSIGNGTFPSSAMEIDGTVSGSGGSLRTTGVGLLTLSGANTYDGGTTLDNGTVALKNSTALGSGMLTIGDTTALPTIYIQAPATLAGAIANAITVNKNFSVDGGLTFSGTVDLGSSDRTITTVNNNNGVTTFSGAISGAGGVIKAGASTLTLAGVNTYTGNTTVNAGTLKLVGSGSLASSPMIKVNNGGMLDATGVTGGANYFVGRFTVLGNQTMKVAGGGALVSTSANVEGIANIGDATGAASWTMSSDLTVGDVGSGAMNVIEGGSVSAHNVSIGKATGSHGTMTIGGSVQNAVLTVGNDLEVGSLGQGLLVVKTGGSVSVGGKFIHDGTGNMYIELSSALAQPGNVPIAITGTASLAGSLEIDPAVGFMPTTGQSFDILTAAGGVSGAFSLVNSQFVTSGQTVNFSAVYGANKVSILIGSIVSAVQGDYNGDGVVNGSDYVVWRTHLGENYALMNRGPSNTGVVVQSDFAFWRAHFGAIGSGAGAVNATAVPEPMSIWLAIAGVALVAGWHRSLSRS